MANKPIKSLDRASVAFRFGDGTIERLPVAEVERQRLVQFARMAASDCPDLRAAGLTGLSEAASRSAGTVVASALQKERATRPRGERTDDAQKRLAALYWSFVDFNGGVYGAQKAFSAQHSVPISTLKKIVSKYPKGSISHDPG